MTTTDSYFNDAVESRKNLENSTYDNSNYDYDVSTDIVDINTNLLKSYTDNNKTISSSIDGSYNTYDIKIGEYSEDKNKFNKLIEEERTDNALLNEKNVSRNYYLLMIWIIILIVVFTCTIIYIISENNVGFYMMFLLGIVVFYSTYSIIKNIF